MTGGGGGEGGKQEGGTGASGGLVFKSQGHCRLFKGDLGQIMGLRTPRSDQLRRKRTPSSEGVSEVSGAGSWSQVLREPADSPPSPCSLYHFLFHTLEAI